MTTADLGDGLQVFPGVAVGGLMVSDATRQEFLDAACARLRSGRTTQFVTVNPEIVQQSKWSERYRRLVQAAEFRTCDGVGVGLAAWSRTGRPLGRVTGVELVEGLLDISASQGLALCVLGATESSRLAFEDHARTKGASVCGGMSGTYSESDPGSFVNAAREALIVLVALGVPKQEILIGQLRQSLVPPRIYVGVGGAIDYLSGAAIRPPDFVRRLGLEWAFRIVTSRGTRIRRQVGTIPAFVWDEIVRPGEQRLRRKLASWERLK